LLVEDNDDHAVLFLDAVERSRAAHFSVQRVANSKDALEQAVPGAFNAILLDYQLGDIDGVDLLERIRAGGTTTPAIVLTSHGSELLAARALRAQADDYLAKTEALVDEAVALAVLRVVERRRLADQLIRAREEAAAARARDAFLAAASHDLKNPLTVIRGTAQVLQRRAGRQGTVPREQLVAGLNSIERAASQMATQIDELLDVAHLRAGRALELNRAPTDVVELAREQVAALQQAAELHRIELRTTVPKLVAEIDGVRVARVLANLLNNAVKYSPQGGQIVVSVSRAGDPVPTPSGDPEAGEAVLTVTDQGMGIPAADLPYIFEQFRRSENVAGHISGTGIGLAIVRQVVEQHGGAVEVESRPGAGSTFTVRLPLRPPS
jgi:signal transduction histidine kinase